MDLWNRLIKIGATLYLTHNTLVGGDKIINNVEGLHKLRHAKAGTMHIPIAGAAFKFVQDNEGQGQLVTIELVRIPAATLNSVITLNDTSDASDAAITIIFSGGPEGSLSVQAKPGGEGVEPIEYTGPWVSSDLRIEKVRLNYTVDSIN